MKPPRTHCGKGHALVGDAVYWYRGYPHCTICRAAYLIEYRRKKGAKPRGRRKTCHAGHPYVGKNLRIYTIKKTGFQMHICVECELRRTRKRRLLERERAKRNGNNCSSQPSDAEKL